MHRRIRKPVLAAGVALTAGGLLSNRAGGPFPNAAGAIARELGGVGAVPEPGSIGILVAAAGGALVTARGRRRRRSTR